MACHCYCRAGSGLGSQCCTQCVAVFGTTSSSSSSSAVCTLFRGVCGLALVSRGESLTVAQWCKATKSTVLQSNQRVSNVSIPLVTIASSSNRGPEDTEREKERYCECGDRTCTWLTFREKSMHFKNVFFSVVL